MSQYIGLISAVIPPEDQSEPSWWFAFQGSRLLVNVHDGIATLPYILNLNELDIDVIRWQYLGRLAGRHCYSAEVSGESKAPEGWKYQGLRAIYGVLSEDLFWVAAAAVQIVDWDRTHQFCGRCGAETQTKTHERAKECPRCGLLSYPRISPAIIVLVEKDNTLLLARSHRHPTGMFSVLAGFVEPGETLEAAVVREIREEVAIAVEGIRYFGSQPWPFPNSLMIAFVCRYAGGEIRVEEEEIAEAGWYTVDNMPPIPPKISIARELIDWFVDKQRRLNG